MSPRARCLEATEEPVVKITPQKEKVLLAPLNCRARVKAIVIGVAKAGEGKENAAGTHAPVEYELTNQSPRKK